MSASVGLFASAIDVFDFETEDERLRYQLLIEELRCPKCQNQNIADSNSPISVDLRREVARMVKEGKPDEQVKEYVVNRYGDFVLYRPPVQENTLVLWWAPVIFVLVGLSVFVTVILRRRASVSDEPALDDDMDENEVTESPLESADDDKNTDRGV